MEEPFLRRAGVTLPEIVVGLVLVGFLVVIGGRLLEKQGEGIRAVAETVESLQAERLARWVLGREVRAGTTGRDWQVAGDGSLPLRAFRGFAVPCNSETLSGETPVRYVGRRTPDPEKDSVLLLGTDGAWRGRALETARRWGSGERGGSGECPGPDGGRLEVWSVSSAAGDWVLARLFERGEYHLNDGALRYRRGEGGRQPLVPEVFGPGSRFLGEGEGLSVEVHLNLPLDGGDEGGVRRWRVRPP